MVRKLGIIVQAHMGSTRLHNKMMKILCGRTVLGHVVSRLKKVQSADELIVATSDLPVDDSIVKECDKYNVSVVRGSDKDVLSRYYKAAKEHDLTDIVRVCADNTLVDWCLIDKEIAEYKKHENVIVATGENVPLGLGGEIFSFSMLEEAFINGKERYHREHVTPYIYEQDYEVIRMNYEKFYGNFRLTLDTESDWLLINKIYEFLYTGEDAITFEQVAEALKNNPSWIRINEHIKQKGIRD